MQKMYNIYVFQFKEKLSTMQNHDIKIINDILEFFGGLTKLAKTIKMSYAQLHRSFSYSGISYKCAKLIEKFSNMRFRAREIMFLHGNRQGKFSNGFYRET